jgi:LmbE family N-acetylglucosaminyl deacetylase
MIYLFISPHPDDVELNCGSTITKLQGEKHIAVFSDCGVDQCETSQAHDVLGVTSHYFNFGRRTFDTHRQEILDTLIELKKRIKPDVVFIPDVADVHQDHQVLGYEGLRAFRDVDVITYIHPYNQLKIEHNYYVKITEDELMNKIKALSRYRSQLDRIYFKLECVKAIARFYGVQCESEYAEAFKIIRKYES